MYEKSKQLLSKIKSVKLCLMAHPDNQIGSEFEDRISDLEDIEKELINSKKQLSEANDKLKEMEWTNVEDGLPPLSLHDNTTSEYVIGVIECEGLIYVDRVSMYNEYLGILNYFIDTYAEKANVIKWKPMPKP